MADSILPKRNWRIAHSESAVGGGGPEQRLLAEINGFRSRGRKVLLIAPENSQIDHRASQADLPALAQCFNQRPRPKLWPCAAPGSSFS